MIKGRRTDITAWLHDSMMDSVTGTSKYEGVTFTAHLASIRCLGGVLGEKASSRQVGRSKSRKASLDLFRSRMLPEVAPGTAAAPARPMVCISVRWMEVLQG